MAEDARPFLPPGRDLPSLRAAAAGCTACPLHLTGTRTVFGEGRPDSLVVLVGEQPGDAEDQTGRPFVGPAGRLLDRALADAGIDRDRAYVTNAVKHFKWEPRGKKRIHAKPSSREVAACHPWLEAELAAIEPRLVVALGATAAQALLGKAFRVTRERGRVLRAGGRAVLATIHPSAVLRMTDPDREPAYAGLVADLRVAAGFLAAAG